ncbi:cyclic nucleotide-binding domain-containing protein [Thiohalophilus thiocyanatoxydans]|uniref:Cyclic nucleotide-binding protein n=1 Tax=Thiohalophilus thiocyanatoxydans TaxID=381308 RepID=A0A4R8IGB7_9GAMM|nr:cyclic nucleotide-binding domain-containing protein [Thiohalophilus thiocyanatoxydans]TDX99601.1 cyclic nucleotide-binding protein [Thiohalophilus thiocyanatoxydans]
MNDKSALSIEQFKTYEPIASLSTERLEELITLITLDSPGIGVSLFREGDIDNQTVYLLEGDIQLVSSDGDMNRVISAHDDAARFPLADGQPRRATATALTRARVIRIDNSILDYMMMWDQMAVSENTVTNSEQESPSSARPQSADSGEPDRSWIRKVRHIMAFEAMPPANIKQLLEKMQPVEVRAGEVIIEQGEPGDYYYVLTEGKAQVTRSIRLASLEAGNSFGEEALLSGGKRNASVTMTSDGQVMRLSKEEFDALLREPLLARIPPDEARVRVAGGARWLDVRHAREFHHNHMPGADNIPLHELRMRLDELDKAAEYICYCTTGKRSAAAAFLLVQNGYKASVLNGGIQVMPQDLQRG